MTKNKLFSIDHITTQDLVEYLKSLKDSDIALRSFYHGENTEEVDRDIKTLRTKRLKVIDELESNDLSENSIQYITDRLASLKMIAQATESKENVEKIIKVFENYLNALKS